LIGREIAEKNLPERGAEKGWFLAGKKALSALRLSNNDLQKEGSSEGHRA